MKADPELASSPREGGGERPDASDHSVRFLNREIQWLEFNDRVLEQAADERTPLLERVRFLSIFSSNLDEFFMKRVGGLRRQMAAGLDIVKAEGVGPAAMLGSIRERVIPLTRRKASCYRKQILPALRAVGIHLLQYEQTTDEEREEIRAWFDANVFPVLTPLAVDPGHRFPFISNLSVSLGAVVRRPGEEEPLFARVKVPEVIDPWYRLGESMRFVDLANIIEHNLETLFPGMEILESLPFRVTRNADLEGDHEDAEDLLAQIQQQLRDRRFAPVVRMQIGKDPSQQLLQFLCDAMELEPRDIYETKGLINYCSLDQIADLPLAEHRFRPWTPITPPRLRDKEQDIFSVIRQGDVLVHHPYESFDDSVERFIEEAAGDPDVLGIKQALYRTSGDSPFIHALIRAAEMGKQVAVLVELRARFDEARNIFWANKLEEAGVHVAYGVVGLKTHTKTTLVVRREGEGLRSYVHIGTGNYHSTTAKLYEDVGLLTCDPILTQDVVHLFNYITGRSARQEYRKLLAAPHNMKAHLLELIDRETRLHEKKGGGRIIAKMNQLQDKDIIKGLYRASAAGVRIDLIVRGFCTLRPGVPGMSDNISVVSIIGRFLEHSRVFWFRNGRKDPLDGDFYIGSADWMYRNLENRVEAACAVETRVLRARLWQVLSVSLDDRRQAWEMQPDGSYRLHRPDGLDADDPAAIGTHQVLMNAALATLPEVTDAKPA